MISWKYSEPPEVPTESQRWCPSGHPKPPPEQWLKATEGREGEMAPRSPLGVTDCPWPSVLPGACAAWEGRREGQREGRRAQRRNWEAV